MRRFPFPRTRMKLPKKSEPAAKPAGGSLAPAPSRHTLHVPAGWLTLMVLLLAVPWLVVAWIYSRGNVAAEPRPVSNGTPVDAARGPWGNLQVSPIVVSPPLEYVSPMGGRGGPPEWFFPGVSAELLELFLASTGVPRDEAARIRASARPAPAIEGLIVSPDPDWLRSLIPEVRARLYRELAKSPLNFDQEQSFRFLGTSPEQWLGGSPISAETRALVEPLIYRDGDFLYFADIELVRPHIRDTAELQRLVKTLLRHSTMLVRLSVPRDAEVDALADYWGRGGRRTDIRPLLESIAGGDTSRSVDIVHLLPTFARNNLYRYPKLTTEDFDRPVLANCLWSALNFFRSTPDDRYLEPEFAISALRKDYFVVEHGYQLGDIIAFLDDEGDLFHVAVYIADNLAFSKNGTSPMAPWTFMRIDQLQEYYRAHADDIRLIYHRRSDL
jgi:hypothetical protein